MYGHYSTHAIGWLAPLADHEPARWLWDAFQRAFPDAIAVTLMPDHPHIIMPMGRRRRVACILGAFARRFGYDQLWRKVEEPSPMTSADKLQRGVRYVALNPCRPAKIAGRHVVLGSDPLVWPWSTHRDVVGAVVAPWVDADRLRQALGWTPHAFVERWHRYVSSDPHVAVAGTALPRPTNAHHLDAIAAAALAATRSARPALTRASDARTTFVGLARRCGWTSSARLAQLCDVHPDTIRRIAQRCPEAWIDAAALCLGDARLIRSAQYARIPDENGLTTTRAGQDVGETGTFA